MSLGGLLSTALAGGAGVIGKQAGDDIEQGRKADLMKQQADIEEQMRMRLAEFNAGVERTSAKNKMLDTRDFNASDDTIAAADKVALAAGKTARGVKLAELTDTGLNEAGRDKAAGDAKAKADADAGILKSQAADPAYLKSINVLKLADPEVRARIAASNASAGASAQSVKESAERLKQLQAVGEMSASVRGLQSKLAGAKTEEERNGLQQQITDLGFNGKDIKSFLSTAEKAMTNGDSAMKLLLDPTASEETKAIARTQLQKANNFADQAAALAGIKAKPQAAPEVPPGAIELLRKDPKMREAFEAKYKVSADQYLTSATTASPTAKPSMLPAVTAAFTDPMKARVDQESRELNDLKRTQYSPEVQTYLDERKRARQEADDKRAADYKAAEFRRAQAGR